MISNCGCVEEVWLLWLKVQKVKPLGGRVGKYIYPGNNIKGYNATGIKIDTGRYK
jgi:hypothetical protein